MASDHLSPPTADLDSRRAARVFSKPIWHELRIFLAVAISGSFNQAADELGYSQPTVARAIRRLEDVVHARLVNRTPSGISLTPAGRGLARFVADLDASIHAKIGNIKETQSSISGLVNLRITEGLASIFAVPNLRKLTQKHPDINFRILLPSHRRTLSDSNSDILIGYAEDDSPDVVSRPLGFIHFIPVVSNEYRSGGADADTSIEHLHFIQSTYYSESKVKEWEPWNRLCQTGLLKFTTDSMFTYASMVLSGHGVGLLGSFMCLNPKLRPLDLGCHITVQLYITIRKTRVMDPAVTACAEWLSTLFSPSNKWFAKTMEIDAQPNEFDYGLRTIFGI